jgi:hypothetical protein
MSPESPRDPLPPATPLEGRSERTSTVAETAHKLAVIESTIDHAIGTIGNVSLYVWRRRTLPAAMPAVIQAFDDARRAGDGRFANYGVIEASADMPEASMRARLAHLMRDAAADMGASALTFEGSGFRAAAGRPAAMGLAAMARQPYPHRVFGDIDTAAVWLVAQVSRRGMSSPSAEDIERAMQDLRNTPPSRPIQ